MQFATISVLLDTCLRVSTCSLLNRKNSVFPAFIVQILNEMLKTGWSGSAVKA